MFLRLFLFVFCFSVLFFSVSGQQARSVASSHEIIPTYDSSYKL